MSDYIFNIPNKQFFVYATILSVTASILFKFWPEQSLFFLLIGSFTSVVISIPKLIRDVYVMFKIKKVMFMRSSTFFCLYFGYSINILALTGWSYALLRPITFGYLDLVWFVVSTIMALTVYNININEKAFNKLLSEVYETKEIPQHKWDDYVLKLRKSCINFIKSDRDILEE